MISKYISKHLGKVITCFYAYGPLYYPLIEIDLKFFHKTCKYCRENVSTVIYFPTDMASFIIILCMYFPATPFLSCHVASECKCQFIKEHFIAYHFYYCQRYRASSQAVQYRYVFLHRWLWLHGCPPQNQQNSLGRHFPKLLPEKKSIKTLTNSGHI